MASLVKRVKLWLRWRRFRRRVRRRLARELRACRNLPQVQAERVYDFASYRWLAGLLREFSDKADSPFYAWHLYAELDRLLQGLGHRPRRVLELGTGSSLGVLYCFLGGGAEAAAGIDIQPIAKDQTEYYEILHGLTMAVAGWRWWRHSAAVERRPGVVYPATYDGREVRALLDRIDYRSPVAAHALPFPGASFDLVYSAAAMEHFDHIPGVVGEIRRVLGPGGLTVHEIDLSHHGSPDPIGFLRWDEAEWEARARRYGGGRGIDQILQGDWKDEVYCNRLRLSDYLACFRAEGFESLKVEVVRRLEPGAIDRSRLAAPFRDRSEEDLAALCVRIAARVPDGPGTRGGGQRPYPDHEGLA